MPLSQQQLASLRRSVSAAVVTRARAYIPTVRITSAGAMHVDALVRGTYDYEVFLTAEGSRLLASCTCPYFDDRREICKHAWAVIEIADARGNLDALAGVTSPRLLAVTPDGDDDAGETEDGWDLADLAARVPPEFQGGWPRALVERRSQARAPRESWRTELRALSTGFELDPVPPTWSGHAQVALVLEPAVPDLPLRFALRPVFREPRRKGGWTKPRPLTLSPRNLDRLPMSREEQALIARLVGSATAGSVFGSPYGASYAPTGLLADDVVPSLCAAGVIVIEDTDDLLPLHWDGGSAWTFVMDVGPAAKGRHLVTGMLHRGGERLPLTEVAIHDGFVRHERTLARLDPGGAARWLRRTWKVRSREVPAAELDEWLAGACALPELPPLRFDPGVGVAIVSRPPVPRLDVILARGAVAQASLHFLYGDLLVPEADEAGAFDSRSREIVRRDREQEARSAARLDQLGIRRQYGWMHTPGPVARMIYPDRVAITATLLSSEGWQVVVDGTAQRVLTGVDAHLRSGIDWFDLEGAARFGAVTVPLPELLEALERGAESVALPDGSRGVIPKDAAHAWRMAARLGHRDGDRTRLTTGEAVLLDRLLDRDRIEPPDAGVQALRARVSAYGGTAPVEAPASFVGTLRPYQRDGLRWFAMLRDLGLGGCLADDMGLGKTVMVLAWLDRLRESGVTSPSLVVMPRSLVFNWIEEARRFTPALRVLDLSHAARKADYASVPGVHLAISTYGTLRRDQAALAAHEFEYVVLDEAQMIKNASTATARAARALRGRHHLALTGTPIENRLTDLWSVLDFANPVLSARGGVGRIASAGTAGDERDRIARAVRPFILRRTKAQVARDLPPRTEQTITCELGPEERRLYDELRDHYRAKLLHSSVRLNTGRARMQVLEALLRLRQAACHPGLIDASRRGEHSAKLDQLLDQIREITAEGSKALVFSQFTSLLALLRARLDAEGHTYEYLDGKTTNRRVRVERFQSDPACPLFLVSLKAGGVGLNLTAAEYVFLLDPWWNPAVEAQAVDRTHRIGQTRPVFAYRLVARDTVEEKVIALQQQKRELADAIIREEETPLSALTREQLDVLLS